MKMTILVDGFLDWLERRRSESKFIRGLFVLLLCAMIFEITAPKAPVLNAAI